MVYRFYRMALYNFQTRHHVIKKSLLTRYTTSLKVNQLHCMNQIVYQLQRFQTPQKPLDLQGKIFDELIII